MHSFFDYGFGFPYLLLEPDRDDGADAGGEDNATDDADEAEEEESEDAEKSDDSEESSEAEKTFTQAEVDELINKRLARERRKSRSKTKAKPKAKEADDDDKAETGLSTIDRRALKSEARTLALAAGVKPDKIKGFVKTLSLDASLLDEDGDPDPDSISDLIDERLELARSLLTPPKVEKKDLGGKTPKSKGSKQGEPKSMAAALRADETGKGK